MVRGGGRPVRLFRSALPGLVVAAWMVFVVAMYLGLQLRRLLEMAGAVR